jgi:hypothetical protein
MMASIVRTHDIVYRVDQSIRVMTRFKRPIDSFDQRHLYVVVRAGIMTNVVRVIGTANPNLENPFDASEYVGVAVVIGRQVSNVCQIILKQIVNPLYCTIY